MSLDIKEELRRTSISLELVSEDAKQIAETVTTNMSSLLLVNDRLQGAAHEYLAAYDNITSGQEDQPISEVVREFLEALNEYLKGNF